MFKSRQYVRDYSRLLPYSVPSGFLSVCVFMDQFLSEGRVGVALPSAHILLVLVGCCFVVSYMAVANFAEL